LHFCAKEILCLLSVHVSVLLNRYGVNDRDTIAYGEGYTVDFGVVLLMTRKSTEATIADFDANGMIWGCAFCIL